MSAATAPYWRTPDFPDRTSEMTNAATAQSVRADADGGADGTPVRPTSAAGTLVWLPALQISRPCSSKTLRDGFPPSLDSVPRTTPLSFTKQSARPGIPWALAIVRERAMGTDNGILRHPATRWRKKARCSVYSCSFSIGSSNLNCKCRRAWQAKTEALQGVSFSITQRRST
jgi:hypothetical protein